LAGPEDFTVTSTLVDEYFTPASVRITYLTRQA
jgi:hypothetical protein